MNTFTTFFFTTIITLTLIACGDSSNSSGSSTTANPSAPTNLKATPTGELAISGNGDQVKLTWTAVGGATSYTVYRATQTMATSANVSPSNLPSLYGATSTSVSTTTSTTETLDGDTYYFFVTASNGSNESNTNASEVSAVPFATVVSPDTTKVWMSRNLGAIQDCISSTDAACYGDLYQWGRNDDGHELRTSSVTRTLATSITPETNTFIQDAPAPFHDWASVDNGGTLRTAAWANNGANDICPTGFSVPTKAELDADTTSATTTRVINSATAFSSFLKIPVAGFRDRTSTNGGLDDVGSAAHLWNRSASGSDGSSFYVGAGSAQFTSNNRAYGRSVRCVKDSTTTSSIVTAYPTSVIADGLASSTITMQAKDVANNSLTSGGLTVTMTQNGSASLSRVTDVGDGRYTATIQSTTAETVTVTAAISGGHVIDTADVIFTAAAATTTQSTVTASPASVAADGSTTSTITMQAKDANENNLASGGLTVAMRVSGSASLSAVTDVGDGRYTATVQSTTAETVTVTATINGSAVIDTADVIFTGEATTADSTVTASITYVATDGIETATITMQAKDANKNNLASGGLAVTMTQSGSASLSTVTDLGDGRYTATIQSTTAETVTVTAAINGSTVTDTANVIFTAFVSRTISFGGLEYKTVLSPDTGEVWLDRNLGASQVATSSADSDAYGYLYQWGRNDDGHELRTSSVTRTLATSITPPETNTFIQAAPEPSYDWVSVVDSDGVLRAAAWENGGANDICPLGFSVPTKAELEADTTSATTVTVTNSATAFSSFLKIPVAGFRNRDGVGFNTGFSALLWSRSAAAGDHDNLSIAFEFYGSGKSDNYARADGFSIRCIAD